MVNHLNLRLNSQFNQRYGQKTDQKLGQKLGQKLEVYRQTMRHREAVKRNAIARRIYQAQILSRQAANFLHQTYLVDRVWLFGSLLTHEWFTLTSDIDLAVVWLSADDYLNAIAKLQDLSPDFKIDLVQIESCSPSLKAEILHSGELL